MTLTPLILSGALSVLRGQLVTPPSPSWDAKSPSDQVTLAVDFGPCVPEGSTIVQADLQTSDSLLVLTQPAWTGTVVTLQAAGGTAGAVPTVYVTAVLASGQQVTRGALLPLLDLGQAPVTAQGVLTLNGFPLTVGGQQILISRPTLSASAELSVGGYNLTI